MPLQTCERSQASGFKSTSEYLAVDLHRQHLLLTEIAEALEDGEPEQAEERLRELQSGLARHIRLEEDVVLPILERRCEQRRRTLAMREEHREISAALQAMSVALWDGARPAFVEARERLLTMLLLHECKDRALHDLVDRALGPAGAAELAARLELSGWRPA